MTSVVTLEQIEALGTKAREAGMTMLARVVRANWPQVDQACKMYAVHRVGEQFRNVGYGCSDSSFGHLIARLRRELGSVAATDKPDVVSHDTKRESSNTSNTTIDQPVIEHMREAPVEPGAVIGGVSNAQMLSDARNAARKFKQQRPLTIVTNKER
jgi:hypothetical protein